MGLNGRVLPAYQSPVVSFQNHPSVVRDSPSRVDQRNATLHRGRPLPPYHVVEGEGDRPWSIGSWVPETAVHCPTEGCQPKRTAGRCSTRTPHDPAIESRQPRSRI